MHKNSILQHKNAHLSDAKTIPHRVKMFLKSQEYIFINIKSKFKRSYTVPV